MSNTEPAMLPLSLGEQIAAARKRAKLSQDQLGARWAESRSTISRWERGDGEPRFSQVVDLCQVSGWPIELLARAYNPTPDGPHDPSGLGITASGWNEDQGATVTPIRTLRAEPAAA